MDKMREEFVECECPFCGEKDEVDVNEPLFFGRSDKDNRFCVCCSECGASGPMKDTTRGALEAWQALSQQPESEPVGVFGFLRRTFGGTREFQGYLCNGVAEPANGDLLYTSPQPSVQVPEWTDKQCLEFIKVALRHVEHTDGSTLRLDDVRLGVKFALKAAPSIAEKGEDHE